jgi:hypothetical protein
LSPYSKNRGSEQKTHSSRAPISSPITIHPLLSPLQPLLLRVEKGLPIRSLGYFWLPAWTRKPTSASFGPPLRCPPLLRHHRRTPIAPAGPTCRRMEHCHRRPKHNPSRHQAPPIATPSISMVGTTQAQRELRRICDHLAGPRPTVSSGLGLDLPASEPDSPAPDSIRCPQSLIRRIPRRRRPPPGDAAPMARQQHRRRRLRTRLELRECRLRAPRQLRRAATP